MSNEANQLLKLCQEFIKEQRIYGPENVYQSDRVIDNAYVFIAEICDIVGYEEYVEEVDEDEEE